MNNDLFIKDATKWLEQNRINYQLGDNDSIQISAKLKDQNKDEDHEITPIYFALLLLDNENKKVIYHHRAYSEGSSRNQSIDIEHSNIDTDEKDSWIAVSILISMMSEIALKTGFILEKVNEKEITKHIHVKNGFCPICNHKINENSSCPTCGYHISMISEGSTQKSGFISPIIEKLFKSDDSKKNKRNLLIILISVILIIILIMVIALSGRKNNEQDPLDPLNPITNSAVVSSGVESTDLGNIMSGQYYFATEDYIFYSSYDTNNESHIYSVKKDGTDLQPIFDGFGWSLVVIDDWLYFSGNQGTIIDGTYNLFRMKFDGSDLQKLNDKYSYGMFLYGDRLYYMESIDSTNTRMSISSSNLDGTNKEVLVPEGYSPLIHDDKLYYIDGTRNIFKTDPDGTNPKIIVQSTVNFYIISGDSIFYIKNNQIQTCDLEGNNHQVIIESSTLPLLSLNYHNDRLFYSDYETTFDFQLMGYHYNIYSVKIDGSDKKLVFSSVSYGIYMNLVNNKLMLMDYAQGSSTSPMTAVIKVMNLDGSAQTIIDR